MEKNAFTKEQFRALVEKLGGVIVTDTNGLVPQFPPRPGVHDTHLQLTNKGYLAIVECNKVKPLYGTFPQNLTCPHVDSGVKTSPSTTHFSKQARINYSL